MKTLVLEGILKGEWLSVSREMIKTKAAKHNCSKSDYPFKVSEKSNWNNQRNLENELKNNEFL